VRLPPLRLPAPPACLFRRAGHPRRPPRAAGLTPRPRLWSRPRAPRAGESPNDRNDRAIRRVAEWYAARLAGRLPVLFLSNDRASRELAAQQGLSASGTAAYARTRLDAPELLDIAARYEEGAEPMEQVGGPWRLAVGAAAAGGCSASGAGGGRAPWGQAGGQRGRRAGRLRARELGCGTPAGRGPASSPQQPGSGLVGARAAAPASALS
jgi:hypothetical protein